jgi:hypothetical protein
MPTFQFIECDLALNTLPGAAIETIDAIDENDARRWLAKLAHDRRQPNKLLGVVEEED